MKSHQRQKDVLFSVIVFCCAFAVNLLIQKIFTTQTLVPMIFVFGVFLISLKTHGYLYLSIHAGKVLTYAAIIRAVWGYSDYGSVKKLQVNMKNIRKKMGVTPGEKRYIINELGVGYRMLEDDK